MTSLAQEIESLPAPAAPRITFAKALSRGRGAIRWLVSVEGRVDGCVVRCDAGWSAARLEGGYHLREIATGIKTRREAGQLIATRSLV